LTDKRKSFNDDAQLMKWAQEFIGDKLSSLEYGVELLMGSFPNASVPAMLYCFSIIDMLGSLYCGEAHKKSDNTKNSIKYMKDMMGYTQDECDLLIQIFRHKPVHLAGPNSVYDKDGDRITWMNACDLPGRHLNLKSISLRYLTPPNTRIKHRVTHCFWLSIEKFVEDIKQSVQKPDGYLSKLEIEPTLREKLDDTVWDMFSPHG
jgi:hypothetical protein